MEMMMTKLLLLLGFSRLLESKHNCEKTRRVKLYKIESMIFAIF